MSNFNEGQLDKLLRKRADCEAKGINPPPQLHLSQLAQKFQITEQEIVNRLNQIRQPRMKIE